MTIHSKNNWDFGQEITEEVIDEIIYVVNSNKRVLAFAIMNRCDQFAYFIMNNGTLEKILQNSPKSLRSQIKEIWERIHKKLNKKE